MHITRPAATMADVARAAGVSHQTVSRVLNDHPSVSVETRQKVRDAMAALGYRRNSAARALATGTSRIIGVLVSSTSLSGPSGTLLAIEPIARKHGYWMSLAGLQSASPSEVIEVISHFSDQGVDGIIAVAQTHPALEATIQATATVPTVLITSGEVPPGRFFTDIDQAAGSRALMELLLRQGHTRIGHVAGPAGDIHAEVRAATWRDCLHDHPESLPLVETGDWSSESGYRATQALFATANPPSAIFAANDRMAYGALRALSEQGLTVPDDVSVVGFDDIDGSDHTIPPLTTVRQDHGLLGATAMDLLLEAMRGAPARSVIITPEVIQRHSTAPLHH